MALAIAVMTMVIVIMATLITIIYSRLGNLIEVISDQSDVMVELIRLLTKKQSPAEGEDSNA